MSPFAARSARSGLLWLALAAAPLTGTGAGREVTGIADWPCTEWSARRAEDRRVDAPQMWLSGFMTALAAAYRVDALAIIDAPTLFARMDGYCAEHPDEHVSTGAQWLFRELLQALPKGPPRLL